MSSFLSDPSITKLIIFALAGMIAVLVVALIFLGIRKNIYYVDEFGEEVEPVRKNAGKLFGRRPEEAAVQPRETMPRETAPQESRPQAKPSAFRKAEPDLEATKAVPVSVNPQAASGVVLGIRIGDDNEERTVTQFPCVIGRGASCDLMIAESAVGRQHVRLFMKDGMINAEDLAEHNGTYINGTKMGKGTRTALHKGDRLNIGRVLVTVKNILY